MTKRKVSLVLSVMLIVSVLLGNVCLVSASEGSYSGGTGTAEDPYLISTAADFLAIPDGATAVYKVTADITLPDSYQPKTFAGTLTAGAAADMKTITVAITGESENTYEATYGTGLFTTLYGTGKIEYIKLAGTVTGTNLVGGFAGIMLDSSTINGCTNTAVITGNGSNVGGLVGAVRDTTTVTAINNSHNKGNVTNISRSGSWTGGLVGHSTQNVYGSSNTANITGHTSVGGLMGSLYTRSTTAIRRSFNAGRVYGDNYVGGIVGSTRYAEGTIVSCYNSGRVIAAGVEEDGSYAESAKIYCGGITAGGMAEVTNTGVTIKTCYNAGEVIGGKDLNNLYSFAGCGGTAGVEVANNATVTNCYVLNHSESFYPTYKKSTTYIKLKTQYQLNKSDMLGTTSSTLPNTDFQTGVASVYPYPRIKANLQDVVYVAPVLTVQLASATAEGQEGSVAISWASAEGANHDMVEISDGTKVIARVSAEEEQYVVTGLDATTEYTFYVSPMNDYKKPKSTSGGVDSITVTATTLENTVKEIAFASAPITFAGAEDPDFVPTDSVTNAEITGGYSIVAARFVLPTNVTDKDIEYGMLISKTVSGEELTAETCTKVAKAIKNFNGAYGILFYGNMVTGDTYYVRPYIKYDDTYTYGAASSFVFNAR